MDEKVSSRLPFGIQSNYSDYKTTNNGDYNVLMYRSDRSKTSPKRVWIKESAILKNKDWKTKIKVLVSKASPGGDEYPHSIISAPIISISGSVCTETYLIIDFVQSEQEAQNLVSYLETKIFRFLMSLIKNTQNISKGVFAFVPQLSWNEKWTDKKLYERYGLTEDEIEFIESLIKDVNRDDFITSTDMSVDGD